MAGRFLIEAVQRFMRARGYEIHKMPDRQPPMKRPVGDMKCFLEDVAKRGFVPRHILDIGANRGDWCTLAAAAYPGADFVLVEPQVEMAATLDQFCREHPGSRRVEAGAGATEGELTLTVWEDLMGSSLWPTETSPEAVGKQRRTIKIITIDSLFPDGAPLPELVKLDVQGFELEALKGAQRLFGQTELFILEATLHPEKNQGPVASEVVRFMSDRGYEIYDLPGFARRPHDATLGQLDIAFAKSNGILRASSSWN